MIRDPAYTQDIIDIVAYIQEICPPDLVARFREKTGYDASYFHSCSPSKERKVSAVDGSNATIGEAGLFSLIAVRAAESTFSGGARARRRITPIRVMQVRPEPDCQAYRDLYRECFGADPLSGLDAEDIARAATVIRDTVEYWTARQALEGLEPGDLLLLDGAFRVSHASHDLILEDILDEATRRGVLVAAIAKKTSMTWGGGYPLVQAAEGLAAELEIAAPWYIEIPGGLIDQQRHEQWRYGAIFIAKLHPRSPGALKIELPRSLTDTAVSATMSACTAYANDGRIPGYPYPLMDAHRTVILSADIVVQIEQDLMIGFQSMGMNWKDYQGMFGDYHDEFKRY
jgi:hypothetical protein